MTGECDLEAIGVTFMFNVVRGAADLANTRSVFHNFVLHING